MTPFLRDRGISKLVSGPLEAIGSGFRFTEGPLWLPDDTLFFQDLKAGQTWRLGSDGVPSLVRDSTRGANGQTFAPGGVIVFCEQDGRRVSRMARDGTNVETVTESFEGRRLNSPNDIVARSDCALYFTDPPYGVARPEDKELPYQAVFRLDARGGLTPIVHEGFEKPNGLAFSPDEGTLYVNDTARYHVRAFAIGGDGLIVPSSGRILAEFDAGEPGGPDGIKVDADGRLYVAVALGVWVLEPDGSLLGIIAVPKRPSNLAWGSADSRTLFITAGDSLYRIRVETRGIVPPFLPTSKRQEGGEGRRLGASDRAGREGTGPKG
jgi:gluconolactonase